MRGKRINQPSKEELEKDINELDLEHIAAKYKASVSTVRRWLKLNNLHIEKNTKKSEEKTVETAPIPKKKDDEKTMLLLMDMLPLENMTLAGIELFPDKSSVTANTSAEDMLSLVKREIMMKFGSRIHNNTFFSITGTRTMFLLVGKNPENGSDAYSMNEVRQQLYKKYGVVISFAVRKGVSTNIAGELYKYVSDRLDGFIENGIFPSTAVEPEVSEAELETKPLSQTIKIDGSILSDIPAEAEPVKAADKTDDAEKEFLDVLVKDSDDTADTEDTALDDVKTDEADITDGIKEVRLIDSENVSSAWKNILTDDLEIETIIFYTDNTPRISYDDIAEILRHPIGLKTEKVFAGDKGASALDFQLVSMLGFMLHEHPERKFVIVSADKGYVPVADFWQSKGYNVICQHLINRDLPEGETSYKNLSDDEKITLDTSCKNSVIEAFNKSTPQPKKKGKDDEPKKGKKFDQMVFLQKVLPGRTKDVYESIINILSDKEAADSRHIHADFIEIFGGRNGENMYKRLKKHLADYKAI